MRRAGILLPISSLPSKYGIGCFSKESYEFVDFLEKAGQKIWQILPIGPTSYGDSPYQSFSTFAGNPYFIDPKALMKEGLISRSSLEKYSFGKDKTSIDYGRLYIERFKLLRECFKGFHSKKLDKSQDFLAFVDRHSDWLKDYCLFMALKDAHEGKEWLLWEEGIRRRNKKDLKKAESEYKTDMQFYAFCQYYFYKQWHQLKAYANEKGIMIVGDIPIYVAMDSSDVWASPELFQLEGDGRPKAVAGVPPDYFSKTGQLWGNPLYDWDLHKKQGYSWWIKRMESALSLYDAVRIDHFRGFEGYYSIPYGESTAVNGHWEKGPGYDLFDAIKKSFKPSSTEALKEEKTRHKKGLSLAAKPGGLSVIAEDLGVITPAVEKLIARCGFPGMKVLQFAFDDDDSDYLPHNHLADCVVYTGTHDNDTTYGWYRVASRKTRGFLRAYMGGYNIKDVCGVLVRAALSSTADTAIVPLQDYLGLGSEARINIPGTLGGNWVWRCRKKDLTDTMADHIRTLTTLYSR